MVLSSDEIEQQAPHLREGLREDWAGVRAFVGTLDGLEGWCKKFLAGFVRGAQTAIKIENDGVDPNRWAETSGTTVAPKGGCVPGGVDALLSYGGDAAPPERRRNY